MKIACVLGSPHKNGNSSTLAKRFCAAAEKKGAEIQEFFLNRMNYRGCQGCMQCKTKLDHCAVEDDLTAVLDAVRGSDVLVMASPVYYGDVSGQLKLFVDRTFSFLEPDFQTSEQPSRLAPGKKLVFIQSQAGKEEMFTDVFPRYEAFFKWYGFKENYHLRGCGLMQSGSVRDQADLLQQADRIAQKAVVQDS